MNSRQLIETGAHVALYAGRWLQSRQPVPRKALHEYWSASKCRLQHWLTELQDFSLRNMEARPREAAAWAAILPLLEEVLASELLARTFAAAAKAYDEQRREPEAAPVAAGTLSGQLDARNRVLHLISYGQQFAMVEAARLNDLRQKIERWCDMLLSHVALHTDVGELAFEAARCRDFTDDLRASPCGDALARELILASLGQSFQFALGEQPASAEFNAQIAHSAMACLGQVPFAPAISGDSAWLARMQRKADETASWIEELLS
ncbi:MAG TPA: hypothetical protein VFB96_12505 [Pirellulaceae bacterium]|nr:hypothetical protein [Pirellulaceae bacterium]